MSEPGIDFLKIWIERNVTDADRNGSQLRAKTLAEYCIEEAAEVGIASSDLEPKWGSIESVIYEAMRSNVETMREIWNAFARARDEEELRFPLVI